ncbi:MAG: energy transducer TonB [Pseudomonadota bacterium]
MKTWQCVLFSVAVHGLIFGLPVMPNTPPDLHTEEIQLLVLESPPMDSPVEKILESVAAPEPSERIPGTVPPVKQPMREPPSPRKKSVFVSKKVLAAPVPEASPDSDTLSNKPLEMADAKQPASPPVTDGVSDGSTPYVNSSVHSEGGNAGGHGSQGHAVESSVGALGGPQFLHRVVPRYPRLARRMGVEGTVLLRLTIDASGKLIRVEVINGPGNGFDDEAVQAVKHSSYSPAVQNGRPIGCLALLKIEFQLNKTDNAEILLPAVRLPGV